MFKGTYNKTKIVATIGPATQSYEMLKKIILAGVDVCRLNFSHGSHEVHGEVITQIKKVNKELGSSTALLVDLQGPKLRIGKVEGELELKEGAEILISTKEQLSTDKILFVSYPELAQDAKPGERILLNDGKSELELLEIIDDFTLRAKVLNGGILTSNKGFNLPDTNITVPSLTAKDREDLAFALTRNIQYVALSFVRRAEDIIELKKLIAESGKTARVIAKIEKPQALENIDDIIRVSDGIMVARGDLGVELPIQKVPLVQKSLVEKCILAAKPVIIATQMMESMINDSIPTRAEVTDVANAVLDGADAVMLSAETSVGKFPVKVVEIMGKIITDVEEDRRVYYKGVRPDASSPSFAADEICFTAVRMSDHLQAKAIAAMTKSGFTGFKVASYRPQARVFIFTDHKPLLYTLNLVWGVRGIFYDKYESTDQTFEDVIRLLKERGHVSMGDYVINCASMPMNKRQRTNTIKVSLVE